MEITSADRTAIAKLAQSLTGSDYISEDRLSFFCSRIERRIVESKNTSLSGYLNFVRQDANELKELISALTIHTTSWFREAPHFERLSEFLLRHNNYKQKKIRIWSAACSTGEEVYTLGLVLWNLKEQGAIGDFEILGTDIDPLSVSFSREGLYSLKQLDGIPEKYHSYLREAHSAKNRFLTVSPEIRQRVHWDVFNLLGDHTRPEFLIKNINVDFIFCRNVLIYFSSETQEEIVRKLTTFLNEDGLLFLGHSDYVGENKYLDVVYSSIYKRKNNKSDNEMNVISKVKVALTQSEKPQTSDYNSQFKLVTLSNVIEFPKRSKKNKPFILMIEDSSTIRLVMKKILELDFEVISVESAEEGDRCLNSREFDLITLDLNLPGISGTEWIENRSKKGMNHPPVVIVSEMEIVQVPRILSILISGFVDYLSKGELHRSPHKLLELCHSMIKDKSFLSRSMGVLKEKQETHFFPFNKKNFLPKVILIGASTGGPESLSLLLEKLPQGLPPIVIVQHIHPQFGSALSQRLSVISGLRDGVDVHAFTEKEGERLVLKSGCIYMAKGDYHLLLKIEKNEILLETSTAAKVNDLRPSIDILFKSASKLNIDSISILLTGMGSDGAEGLLSLALSGRSFTMIQDEKSSIVFGMPKKALELGAACIMGKPSELRKQIIAQCKVSQSA